VIGVVLIAGALQGYVIGVGPIGQRPVGLIRRALLAVAGLLLALPGGKMLGITTLELAGIAAVIAVPLLAYCAVRNRRLDGVVERPLEVGDAKEVAGQSMAR
jgi:hypothetical protein